MEKFTICFLLCFLVVLSNSFFLNSREFKRMLRIFPRAFEIESKPNSNSFRYRPNRDGYYYDSYDRNDGEPLRNTLKNSKRPNGRYVYIYDKNSYSHGEYCDHPDHQHHHQQQKKYSEDHSDRHQDFRKNKYDNVDGKNDYYNHKNGKTRINNEQDDNEKEEVIKLDKTSFRNKDYITGVLVTIPKIKKEDDVENYYKDQKQENILLQHLLKTENNDHQQRPHPHISEDDIKSYLY